MVNELKQALQKDKVELVRKYGEVPQHTTVTSTGKMPALLKFDRELASNISRVQSQKCTVKFKEGNKRNKRRPRAI